MGGKRKHRTRQRRNDQGSRGGKRVSRRSRRRIGPLKRGSVCGQDTWEERQDAEDLQESDGGE